MNIQLKIFHTNDMHNKLSSEFADFSSRPDLLLDAGDAIGGSNTLFNFKEPILEKMGKLGYDAMAIGNREFHYIRAIMEKRRKEAGFPLLSASILDLKNKSKDIFSPYLIKEIKGVKIAILGLTVQILPPGSLWERIMKFKFLDPVDAVNKYLAELKAKSDFLIVLSHIGKDRDRELAKEVPHIDIIVGGHSHTPLEQPLKTGKTLIVQAGFRATSYGSLILNLKKKGNSYIIDNYKFELLPFVSKRFEV